MFPSSEIYGGLSACWDYGPLGVQLKKNIQNLWWREMTDRADIEGLDASILMHPKVWEASGHVEGFSDPLVDCKDCRQRFSPDELSGEKCPQCGSKNLTKPRPFNLMFKTYAGPLEEESHQVYLRPETAQGIYVNFLNVQTSQRKKIPFGIAQIGKAFRNEITTGNFIFRMREFEQMEMQYFTAPDDSKKAFDYWLEQRKNWLSDMGFSKDQIRLKEHKKEELAHYASKALDIEFRFPMGWRELEGVHHRGDFDLSQHQKFSGKKMQYFCPDKKESFIPHIVETSIGFDRLFLALLCSVYKEESIKGETRILLALPSHLSPVQTAVLPLSKKEHLQELAGKVQKNLAKKWRTEYDDSGSIGKRYRRQDEIGTPYCITIDFDSLKDDKATVRERDSMKQDRVSLSQLSQYLEDKFVKNLK